MRQEARNSPGLPCRLAPAEPANVRDPPILRYHYCDHEVMADVEPVAKKSKQGPPAAATMLRVESCILGPASAGRRGPPESKPAAVSPPEIVRDVNVVSDPPSPQAEPPLELAIISDPGEDLDDELAMVFLRHMVKQDPSLIVRCVVCNLRPATKRADEALGQTHSRDLIVVIPAPPSPPRSRLNPT